MEGVEGTKGYENASLYTDPKRAQPDLLAACFLAPRALAEMGLLVGKQARQQPRVKQAISEPSDKYHGQ